MRNEATLSYRRAASEMVGENLRSLYGPSKALVGSALDYCDLTQEMNDDDILRIGVTGPTDVHRLIC